MGSRSQSTSHGQVEDFDDEIASSRVTIQQDSDGSEEYGWTESSDGASVDDDRGEGEDGSGVDIGLSGRDQLKRPAASAIASRRFKRQKSALNHDYLNILNRDIDDAAHRVCLEDEIDIPASQIGLTFWTSLEKHVFFEALSRLGRHDLQGISSRVGTKSVVEIRHYINILEEGRDRRRNADRRAFVLPADYPSAIEFSQQCCFAQDEAADVISYKQELREERRERDKWGDDWEITPQLAKDIDMRQSDVSFKGPAFTELFHLSRWLNVSYRACMNSSIPSSNWNFIDDKPPSVWSTAFEDFHSLAISFTRRLVQTTLYVSMSRLKARTRVRPTTRQAVRKKDVEAAIASLGISCNRQEFWKKSARRLRLDVYHSPPENDDESDIEEPMSYDQVEAALSGKEAWSLAISTQPGNAEQEQKSGNKHCSQLSDEDEATCSDEGADEETNVIDREANEILEYAVATMPAGPNADGLLKSRLKTERLQDMQADYEDCLASHEAETAMWEMLQTEPQTGRPKPPMPPLDDAEVEMAKADVEKIYPMRSDWSEKIHFRSQWEALDGLKSS